MPVGRHSGPYHLLTLSPSPVPQFTHLGTTLLILCAQRIGSWRCKVPSQHPAQCHGLAAISLSAPVLLLIVTSGDVSVQVPVHTLLWVLLLPGLRQAAQLAVVLPLLCWEHG